MIAYHGKQETKDAVLLQLQGHYDADQIIKGTYWERGKGCAVGCTIHSCEHVQYESLFGIPQSLARLEDRIFEGLPNEKAKEWPLRFMRAIKPGSDLSLVQWQFLRWLMTDAEVNPGINHPLVKDVVSSVATLLAAWIKGDPIDARSARSTESAESAARSARSAAESAAESAAWSARSAAESAYERMADKLVALLEAA
jgi:hypothetical protein